MSRARCWRVRYRKALHAGGADQSCEYVGVGFEDSERRVDEIAFVFIIESVRRDAGPVGLGCLVVVRSMAKMLMAEFEGIDDVSLKLGKIQPGRPAK